MNRLIPLLALAALLIGVLLWLGARESEPDGALEGSSREEQLAPQSPASSEAPAVAVAPTERRVAEPEAQPESTTEAELSAGQHAVLRGRCVDEDGQPLWGCRVKLHGWTANSERMSAHRLEHGDVVWEDPPALETDANGLFELSFAPPPPYQFTLDIHCPDHVSVSGRWSGLDPDARLEFGDVVMLAGGRVHGTVVDSHGAPQAEVGIAMGHDATRSLMHDDQRATVAPRSSHNTRAGADGRFEFENPIQFGAWHVQVHDRQMLSPAAFSLTAERPEIELRVEVRRPEDIDAIEGTVLEEGGAPLRWVHVLPEPDQQGGGRMCRTDAEGRFRLERHGESGAGSHRLRLSREGYETLVTEESFDWGDHDVRLVMRRGLGVHVRVTDRASGEPVLEYGLRLFPEFGSTNQRNSRSFEQRAVGLHEDGLVVIEGVERGPYQLIVETPGGAFVHPLFVELEVVAGTTFVPVQVEAPTLRALRVESGGEPVIGMTAELLRPWDGEQVEVDTHAVEMTRLMAFNRRNALVVQSTTTDAEGEALLSAHGSTPYELRLHGGDHEALVLHGVRLDAVPEPWVVEVQAGATLVGHLTPFELIGQLREKAGLAATGPIDDSERSRLPGLLLSRGEYPNRQAHPGGLENFTLDDEGGFEIAGIPPGSWRLELVSSTAAGSGHMTNTEPVAEVLDLRAGEVREQVLDLSDWLRGTLRGRVWLDGEPYEGQLNFHAELEPDASGRRRMTQASAEADAEGNYVAMLRAANYRAIVRVRSSETGSWTPLLSEETATITPGGERELDLHLRTGRLRLRLVRADGSPIVGMSVQVLHTAIEFLQVQSPPSDAEGRASMSVPTGVLRVQVRPKHLLAPEAMRSFHAEYADDRGALARALVVLGEVLAGSESEPEEVEIRVPEDAGY